MLVVLSPAKKLDYDSPVRTTKHSQPRFVPQAQGLIDVLRQKSATEVSALMSLSDTLARLNVERYQAWEPKFTQTNSRQAVLAFNGDVYEGLDAATLSDDQLDWAQQHVAILSGLYGVLRPFDLMQPYRLEMGTKLATAKGKNLYDYWGTEIADYLNQCLAQQGSDVVVNLASEEYFKSVDQKVLKARVVQCVFQDEKNGTWKIISFYAKRARGLMARYIVDHRIDDPEQLKGFNVDGYAFYPEASTDLKLVFRRPEQ
ncbi:MAG: peroxide stress protein YaaA [Pusillimonas sp.]